jgi:hypothetical protein
MPIMRAVCPECHTGLKTGNPNGFAIGQTVSCPKCQTKFAVEAPPPAKPAPAKPAKPKVVVVDDDDDDDEDQIPAKKKRPRDDDDEDDEDEKPKKKSKKGKKKKSSDDGERSYKNSPIRFIVLGVLLLIMIVLGVLLFLKFQGEGTATGLSVDINKIS